MRLNAPPGQNHAEQDQRGADAAGRREALAQDGHPARQGEYRHEIHVVSRRDVAQADDHLVPDHIAAEGSDQSQEEEVAPDLRLRENRGIDPVFAARQERKDGQQAVGEDFPRREDGAVFLRHEAHEEAVDRPAEGGGQGQQVAAQRDLQPGAVEEHQRHAAEREQRAEQERQAAAYVLRRGGETVVAQPAVRQAEQRRQQRRAAHEESHVAGLRVGEGRVLGQEVHGASGQAEDDEHRLVLPVVAPQPTAVALPERQRPDARVRHHETDQKDLGRSETGQDQYFRADERDTPDGHDGQCNEVHEEFRTSHAINTRPSS